MLDEKELETGAWFGEKCLFEEDRIRTATGVAAIESELAVLNNNDYQRIITKYPQLWETHRKLQSAVCNGELTFYELEYHPPASVPGKSGRYSIFGGRIRQKRVLPSCLANSGS